MSEDRIRTAHAAAQAWAQRRDDAAVNAVLALLDTHAPESLLGDARTEYWWHGCEAMADAIGPGRPAAAVRLLELARVSNQKEGSMATGSGEGLASRENLRRIDAKIAALRAQAPEAPASASAAGPACSCGRTLDTARPAARLAFEVMGDTYEMKLGRCAGCGSHWRALARERFTGPESESAGPIEANEAAALLDLIAACPDPTQARCRCAAHRKIAWG
ncbi:MAG: hypothetical protein HS116_06920 [Planctomycetes bacterium]|nr:hypothetical protein [Planctomycetota bacterium]